MPRMPSHTRLKNEIVTILRSAPARLSARAATAAASEIVSLVNQYKWPVEHLLSGEGVNTAKSRIRQMQTAVQLLSRVYHHSNKKFKNSFGKWQDAYWPYEIDQVILSEMRPDGTVVDKFYPAHIIPMLCSAFADALRKKADLMQASNPGRGGPSRTLGDTRKLLAKQVAQILNGAGVALRQTDDESKSSFARILHEVFAEAGFPKITSVKNYIRHAKG